MSGFTAGEMRKLGFSIGELRMLGYDAAAMLKSGCEVKVLKEAGYTGAQLREAGQTVAALKAAGFAASELLRDTVKGSRRVANPGGCCTAWELMAAGFTRLELTAGGANLHEIFGDKTGLTAARICKEIGARRAQQLTSTDASRQRRCASFQASMRVHAARECCVLYAPPRRRSSARRHAQRGR